MFGPEEKRREIQKEIEKAQMLLAKAEDVDIEEEDGIRPEEDFDEGAELQKVRNMYPHISEGFAF